MVQDENIKQGLEADVVVVGYGAAGSAAAITAHDAWASVIVLEKMSAGGGNSRLSAGVMIDLHDVEAADYVESLSFGTTDRETVQAFVGEAMQNKRWLESLGGETEPLGNFGGIYYPICPTPCWRHMPGSQTMRYHFHIKRRAEEEDKRAWFGEILWNLLSSSVEKRGIRVLTSTPVRELVTNSLGTVTGVLAEFNGSKLPITARKGVILTCGGFEYNSEMKKAFLPYQHFEALGNPGNSGDGIVMAQKVGAQLWHMGAVASPLGFKAPEYEAAFYILLLSDGFIYVDQDGRRFANETVLEMHEMWRTICWFDSRQARYPRVPTYLIFDENTRKKGPLSQKMGVNMDYEWSLDNSKEISRGWIKRGKTVSDLARQIGIDSQVLGETVTGYNAFCKAGKDSAFNRAPDTLTAIETAPYYAIPLLPSLLNTMGGPRRDRLARVIGNNGDPIPRLYSAGELGSIWGFLYEAAGNLTECLAFGRIAGRQAAAEEPWV